MVSTWPTTVRGGYGFAADPALTGRDLLLDPVAVAERLRCRLGAHGPVDIVSSTLVRAKYRIGESLRVVYRLRLSSGAACTVTARLFARGASSGAARRALAATVNGGAVPLLDGTVLPAVVHDSELDAIWWTFPNDRRLLGIADLLQPVDQVAELAEAGGTWRSSEVVEYAPERSVTLRAADAVGASVAYVKAYAPGTVDVGTLASRYDEVAAMLAAAGAGVASPTPIGWSRQRGLLVLEAMPGQRWADLDPDGPPARAALARLGAAIATLHTIGPPGRPATAPIGDLRPFGRLRLTRVMHSAELVAEARPDVADRACRLRAALACGPPEADQPVLLHGDCHPKNALLDGARIVLVDLDQAGLGSPAADLGSLLARLHQDAIVGDRPGGVTSSAAALGALALEGYAAVRPLPSATSLRWHTVAAMVAERAVRAVNRVNGPALERLDEVLAAAEQIHREGVRG